VAQHIGGYRGIITGQPKVASSSALRTSALVRTLVLTWPAVDRRLSPLDRAAPLGYFRVVSDLRVGAAGGRRHALVGKLVRCLAG
jgi:hypothetical protein